MKMLAKGIVFAAFTAACAVHAQQRVAEDEIRSTLAIFYEGWNEHDPDKMVSIYSDDVDHINVWGEWHKGKDDIYADLLVVHRIGAIQPA